ncbi:hypothetical protein Sinac_4021 [Singulisphaera acidiphila DSM 18658]|uniref:Uncharacterized protein n=2 Tax=Singulisphaera acidiphila TaxID=466153 RepID=L0DFU4_SINAD|nr:hypothetical protein Sinac_4021 [Singulisphaera acidiphila DSM 18658]
MFCSVARGWGLYLEFRRNREFAHFVFARRVSLIRAKRFCLVGATFMGLGLVSIALVGWLLIG